jgi:hypothetical protein
LTFANEKRKESNESDEEQDCEPNQIGNFLSMTDAMSKMELVDSLLKEFNID